MNEMGAETLLNKLGIQIIKIPLPFRLNHVNCFLAEGEDGFTILDTGLNNQDSREAWHHFLQGKEVKNILISHYHPDHLGYAGTLQRETGAKVWMSEVDKNSGEQLVEEGFVQTIKQNFNKLGVPTAEGNELITYNKNFIRYIRPFLKVDDYLVEGQKIQFGKFEYEVIFTPGHSDGLVCFYNEENSVLFSTDHILPKITPNISYWFIGDKNPLQTYMNSLKKIEKLNVEYVIPSHGKPFTAANKRIREIFAHHDERLEKILQYMKEPRSVLEVCIHLFGTKLTVHEYRFAIGEAFAHLEYLRYLGECKRTLEDGIFYYSVK